MIYTDIGHTQPNDILWIIIDDELFMIPAGSFRTHELVWGGDIKIEDSMRGRFETTTGYCSVALHSCYPKNERPTRKFLDRLEKQFPVVKYWLFLNGENTDSFYPKDIVRDEK